MRFWRQVRIVCDHIHQHSPGQLCEVAADLAHPNNAHSLVVELHSHETLFLPLAGFHRGRSLWNLAGEGEEHRKGMLGRGDGIAARCVHHHDAALGGGRRVHIIQAGPGPADHLELVGGGDHFGRYLRRAPDDQPIVLLDLLEEFLLGQLGLDVHGQTSLLEDLNSLLGEIVADQDLHFASNSSSALPTPEPSFTG